LSVPYQRVAEAVACLESLSADAIGLLHSIQKALGTIEGQGIDFIEGEYATDGNGNLDGFLVTQVQAALARTALGDIASAIEADRDALASMVNVNNG
jgi:hypothetical protein